MSKGNQQQQRRREARTYVVCTSYTDEWDALRKHVADKNPSWEPVSVLKIARLDEDSEVRLAFYIGDNHRAEGSRRIHLTEPVKGADHWEGSSYGGGDVRASTFMEAIGKLGLPNGGIEGGVSLKPGNGELRIGYG